MGRVRINACCPFAIPLSSASRSHHQAVRRAAQAVERLAATAREELPGTMAAVRLSGMEISDLTMELSDLSHEISQGVRSPARTSRLAASTSSTRAKEQHTTDPLKDATVIPIRVVSPLFSSATGAVGADSLKDATVIPIPCDSLKDATVIPIRVVSPLFSSASGADATVIPIRVVSPLFSSAAGAVGAAASTVGSTVSHVGGTVGAAASHVGGTVGAAASHVGAAASHVGGAAAHIPSVHAHIEGVGSHKVEGAGSVRQEDAVRVGAAAEEQFELSSLPSLVGWLQHRKDKEKHPKGDVRG
ncbi:unnamed protein product [Closterium sp. Naga37s-1]|nr:unnamed protein product [Closterium sp. Naga37s-1]